MSIPFEWICSLISVFWKSKKEKKSHLFQPTLFLEKYFIQTSPYLLQT